MILPAPYPDESWYSIVTRYHIRNGCPYFLSSNEKGKQWIYDSYIGITQNMELSNEGIIDAKQMLKEHTLFYYGSRLLPKKKRSNLVLSILSGTADSKKKSTTRKTPVIKYCSLCVSEDREKYGEIYWHREHQLPLAFVCSKHGTCLHTISGEKTTPFLFELFTPQEAQYEQSPVYLALAKLSKEFLTLPDVYGPTETYNNLRHALEKENYISMRKSRGLKIDVERLHKNLTKTYGATLVTPFFRAEKCSIQLNRLLAWKEQNPTPYILLANLLGLSGETLFGDKIT